MHNTEYLLLILGMTLVTYIPRILPALFLGRFTFPKKVERFLDLIPYTAMTALIFPAVLTVNPDHPSVGLIGAAVALVLAWKKCPVILCVIAAIAADFILYSAVL